MLFIFLLAISSIHVIALTPVEKQNLNLRAGNKALLNLLKSFSAEESVGSGLVTSAGTETSNKCPEGFDQIEDQSECEIVARSLCAHNSRSGKVSASGAWSGDPVGCIFHPSTSYDTCQVFFNTAKSTTPTSQKRWPVCKHISIFTAAGSETSNECPLGFSQIKSQSECTTVASSLCVINSRSGTLSASDAWSTDPVGCIFHPSTSFDSCQVFFNTLKSTTPTSQKRWPVCKRDSERTQSSTAQATSTTGNPGKSNNEQCQGDAECSSGWCHKSGRSRYTWKCATDTRNPNRGSRGSGNKYKKCGADRCIDTDSSQCEDNGKRSAGISVSTDKDDIKCPNGWHVLSGSGWCYVLTGNNDDQLAGDTEYWAICGEDGASCSYNFGQGC